jgi:hypothetical protein
MAPKITPGIYLLRKSVRTPDEKVTVMNASDFPAKFQYAGKEYSLRLTRKGGLVLTTE